MFQSSVQLRMCHKGTDLCIKHLQVWHLAFPVVQGLVAPVRPVQLDRLRSDLQHLNHTIILSHPMVTLPP